MLSSRKFVIIGQPPLHSFTDDWLDITLAFEQDPNEPVSSTEKLLLQANLYLQDNVRSALEVPSSSEVCSPDVAKLVRHDKMCCGRNKYKIILIKLN